MNADVQVKNDIAITIMGFEERYRRNGATGELEPFDVVTYSPRGDIKTRLTREVARMSKVLPAEEAGDNLAYIGAAKLWAVVRPQYEFWKQNNALPMSGTPLAAWGGVSKAQGEVLRNAGLRTVQDVAEASDIVIGKTGIANGLMVRDLARKYLENEQGVKASTALASLQEENATLKEQMAEMMAMMREMQGADDAPKRRGRPRKDEPEAVEAA